MPSKSPTLPTAAGKKHNFTLAPASADALQLAQFAQHYKQQGRLCGIVCANASDANRLLEEFGFFTPDLRCVLFPDWETLPYDAFSPHQDLISERLATLWRIYNGGANQVGEEPADVVFIPASTALYRLAPPGFLAAHTFALKQGQTINEARLREQLVTAGYSHVSQVVSPGEYAVRGSLIDLYPMGATLPLRIDLFDDEIDSIRTFDPDSQRSLYPVPSIRLLPGREYPTTEAAFSQFRSRWREQIEGDPTRSKVYKDIGNGIITAGIEYYLPLFFDETASVFDYLGTQAVLMLHGDVNGSFEQFRQDTQERYKYAQYDIDRPALPPARLFLSAEEFFIAAKTLPQLVGKQAGQANTDTGKTEGTPDFSALPNLTVSRDSNEPLQALQTHLQNSSTRKLILAESTGRQESLLDFLRASSITPPLFDDLAAFQKAANEPLGMVVGQLAKGFHWTAEKLDLITETELFATSSTRRRRRKQEQASDLDALIRDLSELNVGDPVVHTAHGIGRYCGLINMDIGNNQGKQEVQELLHLEYADNATLYVPVSQLHLISRYTGVSADDATLHRLGSGKWEKAKRKAAQQIRDTAAELLNIYARRAARQGHAFRYAAQDYATFASDFAFSETPDQKAAIHAVVQDMISPRPMDRLICGDVGFGKTEVALRAAFIAVMGGKQVAMLAPTTLLAEQHFQTITDRFAKWPVKVAEMSRFRTGKEITAAIQGLGEGSVDIVVGTHKLLSKTVQFNNLGLLIIDEEHRFGVRHKEAIKNLRAEVDVLTLTATPIPRTMGMALEGLRDLSVIATAPQRRLAIKTFVRSHDRSIIREAILRELKRGGQAYFLHNEVATIENRRQTLQEIVPEARIGIAHGQMPERELERVMRDFVAQRFNVLLCSTIIETGIDVPSANTIVIDRADKFGLAQLHQLRGRVGRSHHQAFAYLLVPDLQSLSKKATQRLEAIQQMEELGSGFYLAMHDLEIRGAGEVLGDNQSGNIMEIGFQLYNDMLSQAVQALKAGKEPDLLAPLQAITEINLHAPALLPDDYCGDVHQRLSFYKKLATASSSTQIDNLVEEIADRFGRLPDATHTLIDVHRLRLLGQEYGVKKIDATPHVTVISFVPNPPIDPVSIIHLIQKNRHYQLAGNDKLKIEREIQDPKQRAQMVRDVLRGLVKEQTPAGT